MIQNVVFALLAGAPPQAVLSPEEIRARLEMPVTLRINPERLPVALDELGGQVGVRIRCESELNRAVVIVSVRNKPAKDVLKRLLDGIAAGSVIQNGVVNVGRGVISAEQATKIDAEYLANLKSWFESQYKNLGCGEPMNEAELQRGAALALASFNRDPQFGGIQIHPNVYTIAYKTPMRRFIARLCQAIGPEYLASLGDERAAYITMKNLPKENQDAAQRAIDILEKEQEIWAKNFEGVRKRALSTGSYWLPTQITTEAEPFDKVRLNGFRMSLNAEQRTMNVEVLSGNSPILETQDYLPTKRQRFIQPQGEVFDPMRIEDFRVPLDNRNLRFMTMISNWDGKPKPYDWEVMKQFANPWKYDPLGFSKAQRAGVVAEKLGLNLVAYMGDQAIHNVLYGRQVEPSLGAREVLNNLRFGGYMSSLTKQDDWLTVSCYDPENYLKSQMDRAPLDRFVSRAFQVGCLTINEYCKFRNEIGRYRFGLAALFAQIVQPGFDTLNPYAVLVDIYSELTPGQQAALSGSGLAVENLPPKLGNLVRGVAQSYGGYHNPGDPEGLYTDPPTKNELRKARMTLVFGAPKVGFLSSYGQANGDQFYVRWPNYGFFDATQFAGTSVSPDNILANISPYARMCHAIPITLRIDVPRKQGATISANQYDANLSQPALPKEQFRGTLARLIGG